MKSKTFEEFEQDVQEMPVMPVVPKKKELTAYDYGSIFAAKVKNSLRNGKSPFLPNEQGVIDLKGTYNMCTNELNHGITQIMLKERQSELNAPTGAFVTFDTIRKAQQNGIDCAVIKGQHGFDIQVQNPENKEDIRTMKWFNISQIANPENLKSYLDEQMSLKTQETNAYNKEHNPTFKDKKNPAEKVMDRPNDKVMKINFETPEQYFGQVLAAMSTGTKLIVSKEQAEIFKKQTIDALENEHTKGKIDRFAIFKLASNANTICVNTVKAIRESEKTKTKEDPFLSR